MANKWLGCLLSCRVNFDFVHTIITLSLCNRIFSTHNEELDREGRILMPIYRGRSTLISFSKNAGGGKLFIISLSLNS